jgi:CHASE2 domain-containing sensor protein
LSLKRKFLKGWRSPAACALLTAIAGLLCLGDPWRSWFERLSYDLPFLFAPDRSFTNVIVVERDQKSYDELSQKYDQKWNRSLYVRLLDKLTADAAKLVVFDLFLDDPGTKETDDLLAGAMRTNGNVVLAADYQEFKGLSGGQPSLPLDQFRDAAKTIGLSLVYFDPADRGARLLHTGDETYPSLPWVAAQLAGAPAVLRSTNRLEPRWLNYPKRFDSLRRVSFSDALHQEPGYFRDLHVFVGGAPNTKLQWEKADEFSTPLSRWGEKRQSGVVIHTLAFENLLRGNWLIRSRPVTEFTSVVLIGAILGMLLASLRPWPATVVGFLTAVLIYGGACLLMFGRHVWLPWLIVAGIEVPVALCWSILAHSKRLMREKEMAVNQLDRERKIVDRLLPHAEPSDGTIRLPTKPSDGQQVADARPRSAVPAERTDGKWAPPSVPDHTLVRCIGEGAYGQVWLASDIIGTFHAVKFVYRSAFANAAPFDREFRGIQRFTPISRSHPGFVNILHVGRNEPGSYFYYIMELGDDENQGQKIVPESYSAKTLANMIRKRGKLPVGECVDLALQLTSALDFLHQHRLIHRDIKPSNIIFVNGAPKFADVGLVTDIDTKPRASTYLGTEGYIAPEGPGTPAADVFSLGKVLYEVSMGKDRLQFPDLPTAVFETADPVLLKLNEIILKACEVNPKARYQSAAEMRDDLATLQPK